MAKINPEFSKKIKKYGGFDLNACYNCGNCTAVCSLSTEKNSFPRKIVRYSVLGLDDELKTSVDPWLCYYCGKCSETCPQKANPGELMMSVRRWLISKYDWTGISGLFYTSKIALFTAFILVGIAFITVAFVKKFNTEELMHFGHQFEQYLIYAVFVLIIIPNIFRMFWFTIIKNKIKVPVSLYITGFPTFILHMFTQKNSLKCDDNNSAFRRWFEHLLVVTGYLGLLILTVFFNWFTTENPVVIWLGYIVGGLVFVFTFDFIIARSRKKKEITKFSHTTDWLFVIWLFLLGFTAFIIRILIDTDLINENLWLYIIHLIIIAQWGMLIVPFGKWTHFLYRSFAMYFANIINSEKNFDN